MEKIFEELRKIYKVVGEISEGLIRVAVDFNGNEWFHVLSDGSPAYEQRYDLVGDFSGGLARAFKGNKAFHILPDGSPAYEQRYDMTDDFSEGLAVACEDRKWFHILPDGSPAYEQRYGPSKCYHGELVGHFSEGLARASYANNEWFHILPDGSPAYEQRYGRVGHFEKGLAWVRNGKEKFHIHPDGTRAD